MGRFQQQQLVCQEPVILWADDPTEILASVARAKIRPLPNDKKEIMCCADDTKDEGRALSAVLQRCLSLVCRMQRSLLQLRCQCCNQAQESESDMGLLACLVETFKSLGDGIVTGRISTVSSLSLQALMRLSDLLAMVPAGRLAAVEQMVQDFKAELLLVEVPELECARFCLRHLSCAVLRLDIDLVMERVDTGFEQRAIRSLHHKWIWADLVCLDNAGMEVAVVGRVRMEGSILPVPPKSNAATVIHFKRSLMPSRDQAAALWGVLGMSGDGQVMEMKVALRAEWLVLFNLKLQMRSCQLCLSVLQT